MAQNATVPQLSILNYPFSIKQMPYLDEGELEDYEYPDEEPEDFDGDDDSYITCPECSSLIYEDAPQCPSCGWYVTHQSTQTGWIKWVAIALVVLFLLFSLGL